VRKRYMKERSINSLVMSTTTTLKLPGCRT
jgi:hypothetical protein